MKKTLRAAEMLLLLGCFAAALLHPMEVAAAARETVSQVVLRVLPTLFPFLVLADLLVSTGLAVQLGALMGKVMPRLFKQPSAAGPILALGSLTGYPVGAAATARLYDAKGCTKEQAQRLLPLCNNAGPAFVIGVIGAALWGSPMLGFLLYACHLLAGLWAGALLALPVPRQRDCRIGSAGMRKPFVPALVGAIRQAAMSSLNIAGFLVFFGVVIALLEHFGALGLPGRLFGNPAAGEALFAGLIELTAGLFRIPALSAPLWFKLSLSSLILGLAGLSVFFQVRGVLGEHDLSLKPYLRHKGLQGALAALFTLLLHPLYPRLVSVYMPIPPDLPLEAYKAMSLLMTASFVITMILVLLLCWFEDRRAKRRAG